MSQQNNNNMSEFDEFQKLSISQLFEMYQKNKKLKELIPDDDIKFLQKKVFRLQHESDMREKAYLIEFKRANTLKEQLRECKKELEELKECKEQLKECKEELEDTKINHFEMIEEAKHLERERDTWEQTHLDETDSRYRDNKFMVKATNDLFKSQKRKNKKQIKIFKDLKNYWRCHEVLSDVICYDDNLEPLLKTGTDEWGMPKYR